MKTVYVSNPNLKQYGDLTLERGQVFDLQGQMNDRKLLNHGYVVEVEDVSAIDDCLGCGRKFVDSSARQRHQRQAQHPAVDLDIGPLRQPRTALVLDRDPDGSGDWELEPEGAPPPPPPEETGIAGSDPRTAGMSVRRDRTAKGARETLRLEA